MTTALNRVPAGVPAGGQFAPTQHGEPDGVLGGVVGYDVAAMTDEEAYCTLVLEQWRADPGPVIHAYGLPSDATEQQVVTTIQQDWNNADGTLPGLAAGENLVFRSSLLALRHHQDSRFVPVSTRSTERTWTDYGNAGEYSVGSEFSRRFLWATGKPDEPYIQATVTSYVSVSGADGLMPRGDHDAALEELDSADRKDAIAGQIEAAVDAGRLVDQRGDAARLRTEAAQARSDIGTLTYGVEEMVTWRGLTSLGLGSEPVRESVEHSDMDSGRAYDSLDAAEAAAHAAVSQVRGLCPENWR